MAEEKGIAALTKKVNALAKDVRAMERTVPMDPAQKQNVASAIAREARGNEKRIFIGWQPVMLRMALRSKKTLIGLKADQIMG